MEKCISKYLGGAGSPEKKLNVVDIGSTDVNGSYRQFFPVERFNYVGVDMAPGKGVDLVISDPYKIPIQDNFADAVISGQMLEHNEFFWLTFAEKIRILNHNGFVFMIAPSKGIIHRYPVDCYRYYPDSYAALAKYTNSILVDCWIDTASEWGDLVGVFIKSYRDGFTRFDTTKIKTLLPPAPAPAPAAASATKPAAPAAPTAKPAAPVSAA